MWRDIQQDGPASLPAPPEDPAPERGGHHYRHWRPPRKKPTRLAIGMEGGFDLGEEKFEYDEDVKIVILPDYLEIARDGLGACLTSSEIG